MEHDINTPAPIASPELLQELESLVTAIEEALALIAGTVAELNGPGATLRQLCAGRDMLAVNNGPNEWRERLLRSALRIVALKAQHSDDPILLALIASVLPGRNTGETNH